jgi:hypothetical protein
MNRIIGESGTQTRRKVYLAAVLAGLMGFNIMESAHATTQISGVTVTGISIYMGNSGATGAYVTITPSQSGVEGCSAGTAVWIDFSVQTAPDGKALYATVLAAYIAGKAVTFGVSGCGYSGHPQVYRVDIS